MNIRAGCNKHGILLVEALLAIVVLGVSISAAVKSYTYAARVHILSADYLKAGALAQEKMAQLDALPKLLDGASSGEFEGPDKGFRWKVNIRKEGKSGEDETQKDSGPQFYRVSVIVRWGKPDERALDIHSMLLKTPPDAARIQESGPTQERSASQTEGQNRAGALQPGSNIPIQ